MEHEFFIDRLQIETNALFLYNNHFCLIWKSQDSSSNEAIEELKDNFKVVDNYINEENVKSDFEYKYTPGKMNLI